MTNAPGILAVAAIAILGGLGLWLVLQVTGSPAGLPNPPGPGPGVTVEVPGEVPEPIDETSDVSADLEVAIELRTRARILPSPSSVEAPLGLVDRASEIGFLTRPAGPTLAEYTLLTDRAVYRVIDLDRPRPMTMPDVDLRGRVVDESAEPVEGAEVWYGEAADGVRQIVTTDGDGVFLVPSMLGGRGIPLVVTAPGRTSQYKVLELDRSVYPEPLFVLEPGVTVSVQIAGDLATPRDTRVFLAPRGAGDSRLQQFPFFLGALDDGWRMDGDGRVQIPGLPAGAQVEVIALHPLAVARRPVPVTLREGAEAVVPLRTQPTFTGRVVDTEGRPIAGALVVGLHHESELAALGHSRRWLLPLEVDMFGVAHVRTDGEGRFTVADEDLLRVTAPGYVEMEIRTEDADAADDIVLHEPRPGEATLQIHVPDCSNSYRIRCRPHANEWRTIACGEPFVLELPEPSVVDISVQIRRDGVVSEPRVFTGLVVQGLTELDLR